MIDTAILLAAGEGSRLRSVAPLKPLCEVGGRSLLAHALHGLAAAGIERAIVVLGYRAEGIGAYLAADAWPLAVETVRTDDHRRPNGCSVLSAAPLVAGAETLLAMCDHLVEPALYRLMAETGAGTGARLAIDRRLDNDWVDLDDVTRVETDGDRIVAIGKGLDCYDAFDTGVFAIGRALFDALGTLDAPSLTDGMRLMARNGAASIIDCGDLRWIDVDDEPALAKANAAYATLASFTSSGSRST